MTGMQQARVKHQNITAHATEHSYVPKINMISSLSLSIMIMGFSKSTKIKR